MEVQHRPGSPHKNADDLSRGGRDVTKPTKCSPESLRSPELLVQPSWFTETIELLLLLFRRM